MTSDVPPLEDSGSPPDDPRGLGGSWRGVSFVDGALRRLMPLKYGSLRRWQRRAISSGFIGVFVLLALGATGLLLGPYLANDHYNRGNQLAAKRDYRAAIDEYTWSIEGNSKNVAAYVNRGSAYRELGDHDRALADFNKALTIDPTDALAHYNRGRELAAKHDYRGAIDDFTNAITENPKAVAAYVSRGNAYGELGDSDHALADWNKALEIDPSNLNAHRNRGIMFFRLEQYDAALLELNKAIELDPGFGPAFGSRGEVYRVKHDNYRAIADFDKAIDLGGLGVDEATTYRQRGRAYYELNRLEPAFNDFTKAIELAPTAQAYAGRALVYADKKNFDAAIAEVNKASTLADDPDSKAALQEIRDYIARKRQ